MILLAYIILSFTTIQLLVALANLFFETTLPESNIIHSELVSVLIPARNEEKNIGNVIDDLESEAYQNIEVIIFNDESNDRTAEIVKKYAINDPRIRLIESTGLPDGWLGKNYACHSLSKEAKGRYMLFLDADVRIGKNLIGRAVSYSAKHDLSLVSIFPKQLIKTSGEKITVPNMNYILVSLLPLILVRKLNFPSLSAANGQFMFFRSEEYKKIRPHMLVRGNKVEDIIIARIYKRNRLNIACMVGDDSITCRMYTGFSEAIRGFSKNVTAFFGNSFITAVLFWAVTTFGIIPVVFALPPLFLFVYLTMYLLIRIIISIISRQNILHNLLFVLPLQVSMALFIYRAFINKYFRKYQWKGRNIA